MSLNPKITDWRGQRVWLLGASSGIGAELAQQLAALGAHVVLSARRAEVLDSLLQSLPGDGHVAMVCDASDQAALVATAAQIHSALDGLDLAVYLAGDYVPLRAWDFTPQQVRQLCEVNYLGAVNFTHAALPLLRRAPPGKSGGLVLVSSVAGYRGLPKALGYGPAKAALIHFAEDIYLDLHPQGMGVWVVNPGFVATRLTAQNDFHMPALITPEVAVKSLLAGLASGRFDIHFPKRFTRFMKFLRLLPYRAYFALVGRTAGDKE